MTHPEGQGRIGPEWQQAEAGHQRSSWTTEWHSWIWPSPGERMKTVRRVWMGTVDMEKHSPARSLTGRANRWYPGSELAEHRSKVCAYGRWCAGEYVMHVPCVRTDWRSMLEDTAAVTVSSSASILGTMSERLIDVVGVFLSAHTLCFSYPESWWPPWWTSAASSSQRPPAHSLPPWHPPWVWRRRRGLCPCTSRGDGHRNSDWPRLLSTPWQERSFNFSQNFITYTNEQNKLNSQRP